MHKLNITCDVLDKLGFSKYYDKNGDSGFRTLTFSDGTEFIISQQCELDDCSYGYGYGHYLAECFYFDSRYAEPQIHKEFDLFFLHEMHECIEQCYPNKLSEFVEICKSVKMGWYIDSFLNEKIKNNGRNKSN